MVFPLLVIFAYFLGAVPFGLLLGRLFADVDVRQMGSGNIGATNVNRVLGRKLGAATLLCDVLKVVVPTLLGRLFLDSIFDVAVVGAVGILGHCFPVFLRFKGGKGVASAFGALLVVAPISALLAMGVWLISFRISRVSAAGALAASAAIPIFVFFEINISVALIFLAISILIFIRHRENIIRMKKGEELSIR